MSTAKIAVCEYRRSARLHLLALVKSKHLSIKIPFDRYLIFGYLDQPICCVSVRYLLPLLEDAFLGFRCKSLSASFSESAQNIDDGVSIDMAARCSE